MWNKDALKCPEEMAKVVNILPGEESHWLNFFLLRVRLKRTMKRCFLFCLAWEYFMVLLCVFTIQLERTGANIIAAIAAAM